MEIDRTDGDIKDDEKQASNPVLPDENDKDLKAKPAVEMDLDESRHEADDSVAGGDQVVTGEEPMDEGTQFNKLQLPIFF